MLRISMDKLAASETVTATNNNTNKNKIKSIQWIFNLYLQKKYLLLLLLDNNSDKNNTNLNNRLIKIKYQLLKILANTVLLAVFKKISTSN